MNSADRAVWLIPVGLMALSAIPTVAGIARVLQLALGTHWTAAGARFFMAPVPVILQVFGSVIFCVLGALRFSPRLRRRCPHWHRGAARTLVPCGLAAALAAVWIAQFYAAAIHASAGFGGLFHGFVGVAAGSAMAMSLCLGYTGISGRDIPGHRVWMVRGCALALGATTQATTQLPWHVLADTQAEMARTLLMATGWAVNLALAHWSVSSVPSVSSVSSVLAERQKPSHRLPIPCATTPL